MVELLEAQGLKCWIAPRDVAPSADWAAEIIDAISAARFMVLVFSASSNQSPQVRREVERAVHKGVSVLPFRIEDVLPSKSLEFFLSAQHWMDAFYPPRDSHYRRLASHLAAQLAAPRDIPRSPAAPPGGTEIRDALSPVECAQVESQLAYYVGPLAGYLVRREARQAATIDELIARLSTEVDAEPDRAAFIRRCRSPSGSR
jgi:hypothetical protein